MNKLDNKIIDIYIKTNKTKEFVNKKPGIQEILYFAKHSSENDLTELTRYVLNNNNLDLIVDYAMYAKTISEKDIEKIVNSVCNSKRAEYISRLARHVTTLTVEHFSLLTKAIANTGNYSEIIKYYIGVKDLSEQNRLILFNTIVNSKNNIAIVDFISKISSLNEKELSCLIEGLDSNSSFDYKRVQKLSKLSKDNKYALLLKVLSTNNVKFIFSFLTDYEEYVTEYQKVIFNSFNRLNDLKALVEFYTDLSTHNISYETVVTNRIKEENDAKSAVYFLSKYTMLNKENINTLEKIILNSNDKALIVKYIFLTTNIALAKEIFGDFMYFYVFCKDILKMDINLEEFKASLEINANEEYIKYADDNIENYNKAVAPSKKN